jgi:hypothetical protein
MADTAATRTQRKNKDDAVKESQSTIRGADPAKKWLVENELITKGEDHTMSMMASALFQLCSGKFPQPKDMINGMRAIAICMEEIIQTRHTSDALDTIKEQVEDIVKEAKDSIEELVGGVKTVMKETEERLKKHGEGGGKVEVEKIIEKAVQSATKPSYAQILGNGSDSRTASRDLQIKNDTKARTQLQQKQIILDGDDAMKEKAGKLTPKELILKANLALEKLDTDMADVLQEDNNERPEDAKFVAARILKNGGILFEMESENGAEWLKNAEITKNFEKCFPGNVSVKGKTYQVVVQFLPVRLKNRLEELITGIEKENNLSAGSITSARWLRNPDNWGASQTKAHAILSVKYRTKANNIISNGVLIDGSRHEARKLEEDPKRCYKCQIIGAGHSAASCKSEEVCSNCAKDHSTGECRATQADFRCATCKKDGGQDDHAAWDRQCPAFIEEKARLRDRKPENHYRFFPSVHEDWTWVRHEDSLADGFTDRWMGNDAKRGPNLPRDARRDDGWGRPLGHGTQRTTDTWTPRTVNSWAPGDRHRPDNQRRRSNERERSGEQNTRNRDEQRHNDRSQSRGRTSQPQPQKDKSPRQSSIINWMPIRNGSGERSRRDESSARRRQPETEYRSSQPNRK